MTYRVQRRDPETKRWNRLCDLKDRELAEIALQKWRDYWIEHGRPSEQMRIIEITR